jgi:hypothetical protein
MNADPAGFIWVSEEWGMLLCMFKAIETYSLVPLLAVHP